MPRLLVVAPAGTEPRVGPEHGYDVVREEELLKCHSVAEVRAARGAPYVTISPVAPTPSKPGYGPALEAAGVADAVAVADGMAVFALGGVTPGNARSFLDAGAYGIAVMGPVLRADDPAAVVRTYLEVLG